jgi:6-phosphogluconolactonase (cycloisomerase 2 family)
MAASIVGLWVLGCAALAAQNGTIKVSPDPVSFGSQTVGTSATQRVTLSNGRMTPLPITSISISGPFTQTNSCGTIVAAKGKCTIDVRFAPTALGAATGALTIVHGAAGSPVIVNVTGTAVAPSLRSITVTPATPSIPLGGVQAFTATGRTSNGTQVDVTALATWTSSNGAVATVGSAAGSSGFAVSSGVGTTTISASLSGTTGTTALSVTAPPTFASRFAYAVNQGTPNTLSGWSVDVASGALRPLAGFPAAVTSRPNAIAVEPAGRYAFVAHYHDHEVSSLRIDGATGALAPIAGSRLPAGTHPLGVAVTPSGRFVYVANVDSGNVSAYAVAPATGVLSAVPGSPFPTGPGSWSVSTDALGRFLYVPNLAADANTLSVFTIDGSTGALTPVPGAPFAMRTSPAAVAADPLGRFVFVANVGDSSVSAYLVNRVTGALTPSPGSPFRTGGGPGALVVDLTGRFVYVAAESSSDIWAFAINASTGALTAVAGSPFATGTSPRTLALDRGGRFLYSGNIAVDTVSAFAIDATTGALSAVAGSPFASGDFPGSLAVMGAPSSPTATLQSLAVTPASVTIDTGASTAYTATGTYSDGTQRFVTAGATWSTANGAVATVSNAAGSQGVITGVSGGTTSVTATIGSVVGSASATVNPSTLVSIAVAPPSATAPAGTTSQFSATGTFSNGTQQNVTALATWQSGNTGIATVSNAAGSKGAAAAVAAGATTISASIGAVTGVASLTVTPPVLSTITVAPANTLVGLGARRQVTASGTFTDGSTQDVTTTVVWSSSNDTIVDIGNPPGAVGVATALGDGTATLTARQGTVAGTTALTVRRPTNRFVFAGEVVSGVIASYSVDAESGVVTLAPGSFASAPNVDSIAVDPAGRFLYASRANDARISGYRIDAATGVLTPLPASPFDTVQPAVGVEFDPSGRFLFVSLSEGIHAFAVDSSSGVLTDVPGSPWPVAAGLRALAAHPSGRFVYTAHAPPTSVTDPGTIHVHAIGAEGVVSPLETLTISGPSSPIEIALDPTGRFLAVADEIARAIRVYAVDQASGALTPLPGYPLMVDINVIEAVAFDSSGSRLFVGARNSGLMVVLSFDRASGAAVPIPGSPFPLGSDSQPSELALAPSGRTLYVAGGSSGALAALAIDATTGALSSLAGSPYPRISNAFLRATTSVAATGGLTDPAATLVSLQITPAVATVPIGSALQLTALGTYSDGSTRFLTDTAAWTSSAGAIASVTTIAGAKGRVQGSSPGTATITATVGTIAGAATITVPAPPVLLTSIAIAPASASILVGATRPFTATATYDNGTTQDVTGSAIWTSSVPAVATVGSGANNPGVATALVSGTTSIAAAIGSISGSANLTVRPNLPPTADAGLDQQVLTGAAVQLDGRASTDPENQPVTYLWSFVSRPAGSVAVLSDSTSAMPTFVADRGGVYVVQLVVADGVSTSLVDTVSIAANRAPVADAGPDQTVHVTETVRLDGGGSSDADGQSLAFAWSIVSVPAGSAATLSNATLVNPTFVVDRPGSYTVRLVVDDGIEASAADLVVVSTVNSAPVASAGPDQIVTAGDLVHLDGSVSTDVDGDALDYAWAITARPAGSTAQLDDFEAIAPSFVADGPGTYVVQLLVFDGVVVGAADEVTITTTNPAPVADAGPDQTVQVTETVHLSGSGSTDANGDPLTFAWSFVTRPIGSTATLSSASTVTPAFIADRRGTYVVQLITSDGTSDSAPDSVTISTTNTPPVADAGSDQSVSAGGVVTLDASGSHDVDLDPLAYSWSLTSRPEGSVATLSDATALGPTFVADVAGTYVVQLIVNDGTADGAPDTVEILTTPQNVRPVADAGLDQAAIQIAATVTLDGSRSNDVNGDGLTYSWSFITRPIGSAAGLSDPTAVMPTFVADAPGTYVVQLIVHDGQLASTPDTVMIVTVDGNRAPIANAGADQSVNAPGTVQLNGAVSADPDLQPITFAWSFDSIPAGSTAVLAGATTATPSFLADLPGSYVVRLVVSDGALTGADTVTIRSNAPPIANAGPDRDVAVQTVVQLDAADSIDPDAFPGGPLSYQWRLNVRPAASSAVLQAAGVPCGTPSIPCEEAKPTFLADVPGRYVAQLVVNDGLVNSASDTVTITTINLPPVANAGLDRTDVVVGSTVQLDGSASVDPDGLPITHAWSFLSRPVASTTSIVNPATPSPSFFVDVNGTYVVRLVVSDGVSTTEDSVSLVTVNRAPVANAGPNQAIIVGATTTLDGSTSFDPDGTPLTFAWTLASSPAGSVVALNGTSAAPTLSVDTPGTYVVRLVVSDGVLSSAPAEVTVTATRGGLSMRIVGTPVVGVGRSAPLEVELEAAAPDGGTVVSVTSENPTIVSVTPANVGIAAGSRVARFTVTGHGAGGTTTLGATAPEYSDGSLVVSATANLITVPVALNVPITQTAQLPITIAPNGAPANGLTVTVTSDSSTIEVLTPALTIAAGATSINATLRGRLGGPATVTVSATGYASGIAQVTSTGTLNVVEPSASFRDAFARSLTLQLESAGAPVAALGDVVATVVSSDPTCVVVPAAITIGSGFVTATIPLAHGTGTTLPCTATVAVDAPGLVGDTVPVTVEPKPALTLNGFPVVVGAGLQTTAGANGGLVVQLGESNHGGVRVHVTSSNPAAVLLSKDATSPGAADIDIDVPNGTYLVPILVHGVATGTGTAIITATEPHFTASPGGEASVTAPALVIEGLPTSTTSLAADIPFYLQVGLADPGSGTIQIAQAVRAGTTAVVEVTSLDPAAGLIETVAGAAQTRTVTIPGGQSTTPFSLASGGVAFDPVGPGTTTVSATSPGFLPLSAASVVVDVTGPVVSFNGLPVTVGAGLQAVSSPANGLLLAQLGGADHGGVRLRLVSADATVALLSWNASTPGAASIEMDVPNGQTQVPFVVHAPSGAEGTVTITGTAPGMGAGTGMVTVVPPSIEILNLGPDTTSLSSNLPFLVQLGIVNEPGTVLTPQAVRAGTTFTASVTSSNEIVADIVTLAGAAKSQLVVIEAGQSASAQTVATGGLAFDPKNPGTTDVVASGAGLVTTPLSSVRVVVSGASISFSGLPLNVGAGLQASFSPGGVVAALLGGADHGGVRVRIASRNPAMALVSADPLEVGAEFIDIDVPNGQTVAPFTVHALAGASGVVTIDASAPGFAAGFTEATIVEPVLEILGLSPATTSLSNDTPFDVRVGLPDPTGTYVLYPQPVRYGTSVAVTLKSSQPTIGLIKTIHGAAGAQIIVIAGGAFDSNASGSDGLAAFDPIAAGSTVVTATSPGLAALPSATVAVEVSGPGIVFGGLPLTVGAGLQADFNPLTGTVAVQLGGAAHGGVRVRIVSSNPAVALVSSDPLVPGAAFVDIDVPDGQQVVPFVVQALPGTTGTIALTATAVGFSSGLGTVTVVPPAIQLELTTRTTTQSADSLVTVRIGLAEPNGNYLMFTQPVRAGGAVPVEVASDNSGVASLKVTGDLTGGGTRTVLIPGASAFGMLMLDPADPGTATIAATSPGVLSTAAATALVEVVRPTVTLNVLNNIPAVGAGLQQVYWARLDAIGHGGLTVRLASTNPAVALISLDPQVTGVPFVDVDLPAGVTDFTYVVQGLEGMVSPVSIVATAAGFDESAMPLAIVPPAVEINGLDAPTSATAANTVVSVTVGVADQPNSRVLVAQAVRAGAALVATVTNSDGSVAQLVTEAGGAQSRTVVIAGGQAFSGSSAASGGVEFDPLNEGTTTVIVTIPGVVATSRATIPILVLP